MPGTTERPPSATASPPAVAYIPGSGTKQNKQAIPKRCAVVEWEHLGGAQSLPGVAWPREGAQQAVCGL